MPTILAAWQLLSFADDSHAPWPTASPLTWSASVLRWAGFDDGWALAIHEWIHQRPDLYWPMLLTAAAVSAASNARRRPTALLGLATCLYATGLEINNTPGTMWAYLGLSALPCVIAILSDRWPRSATSDFVSDWWQSAFRWLVAVFVVCLNWMTLPFLIVASSVQAYRVERPPRPWPVATGSAVIPPSVA